MEDNTQLDPLFLCLNIHSPTVYLVICRESKKKKEKNKLGYYAKSVLKDRFSNLILKLVGSRMHNILVKMPIV